MSDKDNNEKLLSPAEFQEALLDYFEVCESAEDVRTQLAGELGGEQKRYVESWELTHIEVARLLFKQWAALK